MHTILEVGIMIRGQRDQHEYDIVKAILNRLEKQIKEECFLSNSLSFVHIVGTHEYLTINVCQGEVRFGIFDKNKNELRRDVDINEIRNVLTKEKQAVIIDRVINNKDKTPCNELLAKLWNLSIEQEKILTKDMIYASRIELLTVTEADLKHQPQIASINKRYPSRDDDFER